MHQNALTQTGTVEKGIAIITLNRPEKRNALNIEMMEQICEVLDDLQSQADARVVILNGAGPAFCSGLDLSEATDPDRVQQSASLLARTLRTVWNCRLVTIAAVHGAAMAGGGGVASACDIVVAAERTRWGFPEVRRGLVPALIAAVMGRHMGQHHLRELLLLGETEDTERIREMGLINHVVAQEELLPRALDLARKCLLGAPATQAKAKRLLDQMYGVSIDEQLEQAMAGHVQMRSSPEAQEGIRAFLEKRKPNWVE